MLEQELKLSIEGAFAPKFPPGRSDVAGVDELPSLDLRATYHDTPDLRLARNGVTLRYRSGEGCIIAGRKPHEAYCGLGDPTDLVLALKQPELSSGAYTSC